MPTADSSTQLSDDDAMEIALAEAQIASRAGEVPVAAVTIEGISHYGIYKEAFAEATKLEVDWFSKHLKGAR